MSKQEQPEFNTRTNKKRQKRKRKHVNKYPNHNHPLEERKPIHREKKKSDEKMRREKVKANNVTH